MLTKTEIMREVQRRVSSYDAETLFSARAFNEVLQAAVTSLCSPLKRVPNIHSYYGDPSDQTTAYTDGQTVVMNNANDLIKGMGDLYTAYVAIFGMVTHECGHVLFTDFFEGRKRKEAWLRAPGKLEFYPKTPANLVFNPDDYDPRVIAMFQQELANLDNIEEDAYIENRLYGKFDGLSSMGLHLLNDEMHDKAQPYEEILEMAAEWKISKVSALLSVLLSWKTGYDPVTSGAPLSPDAEQVKNEIADVLAEIKPTIEDLAWERNGKKRTVLLNEVAASLIKLLPKKEDMPEMSGSGSGDGDGEAEESEGDQSQNGQSGNSGNSGNSGKSGNTGNSNQQSGNGSSGSSGQFDQMQQNGNSVLQQSGMTNEAQGNTRPVFEEADEDSKEEEKEKAEDNKQLASDLLKNANSAKSQLEKAMNEVAQKEVESEQEDQHSSELQKEARDIGYKIFQANGAYGNVKYEVVRDADPSALKQLYQQVYATQKTTADHLVRKLENILKDRAQESSDSGYLMGNHFNAKDVWHGDGAYFSRPNVPDGQPDVVFGIMCDESGSMSGRASDGSPRYDVVRRTTIMLEDVLRRLNVPAMIVGHSTGDWSGDVELRPYVDFDTVDGQDKYRLADISARSCNVDGAVIAYTGEKLLKRPEKIKVMIVISDGMPCDGSFFDASPYDDTKKAIQQYRRKGIKVIGAMVADEPAANGLYDPMFFDCAAKGVLEKELVKIVKKYVLAR